jgi:hypothetical protein
MAFSEEQIKRFKLRKWAVFTECQTTKQFIIAERTKHPALPELEGTIRGDVRVYFVQLEVILFLMTKPRQCDYIPFYKERSTVPWVVWKQGKNTAVKGIINTSHLFRNQRWDSFNPTLPRK